MSDLTERESQVLNFIKSFTGAKGYPPTVREIGRAVGLSSTSTVFSYLKRLETKGYLRRNKDMPRAMELTDRDNGAALVRVPLLGRVPAGTPVPAVEHCEESLELPASVVGTGDLFALRVRGNSMVDAGILEGDVVVVRWQTTAENGDIVVALIDDEATVKRFFKENNHIRLQPENRALQPIVTDNAVILGKVVFLFRKY